MKKIKNFTRNVNRIISLLVLSLVQTLTWAQDGSSGVSIKVTKESSSWYTQPWVWIVGGAVFILLLVALLRGSGNKN